MRQAIAADFAGRHAGESRVIMTCDARFPDEPGPWQTVRIAADDDPDRVVNMARAADFTVLIAPETSGILASLTRAFERAGARLLGSSAEAVELAGDKARLAQRLRALAIATPTTRTIAPGDGLPNDAVYPAVIKPVDGAGSIDTFYVHDSSGVPHRASELPIALLQPFVSGEPMSASFLVDQRGVAWLIGVGTQRMAIRDGRFEYLGGTMPVACQAAISQMEPAVAAIDGLRGFVGVDFIWDVESNRATVLEINPRPTTSYVGWCRLLPPGMLAGAWLAACDPAHHNPSILAQMAAVIQKTRGRISFDTRGEIVHHDVGVSMS